MQIKSKHIFFTLAVALCLSISFNLFPFDYAGFVTPVAFKKTDDGNIPIRNDDLGDGFYHAPRQGGRRHKGIDLAKPIGSAVRAVRSGKVVVAEELGNYGKHIKIDHGNGRMSVYAHLSDIFVKPGQKVWQGETIGAVGRTGNADFDEMIPHLHFELRQDDIRFDPTLSVQNGLSSEGWNFVVDIIRLYMRDFGVSISRLLKNRVGVGNQLTEISSGPEDR